MEHLEIPSLFYHGTTVFEKEVLGEMQEVNRFSNIFDIEEVGIKPTDSDGVSVSELFDLALAIMQPDLDIRTRELKPLEIVVYEIMPVEEDLQNGSIMIEEIVRPYRWVINPKVPPYWLKGKYIIDVNHEEPESLVRRLCKEALVRNQPPEDSLITYVKLNLEGH